MSVKTITGQALIKAAKELVHREFSGKDIVFYSPEWDDIIIQEYAPEYVFFDVLEGLYVYNLNKECDSDGLWTVKFMKYYMIGEL